MKNILLIGVGGTGSNAVDILYSKIDEIGNLTKSQVTAIVFDTDVGSVETIKSATPVPMADPASVGTICDRIGKEYIREWFPCDDKAVLAQEMVRGASQWRKKSYLAFLNLMNKPQARSSFIGALEDMSKDPSATCEVYVIASIAGGTGSGSFIPIALYARRYLRQKLGKNPIVNAMIALPDIYADAQTEDNRIKIYANAYAILRELNAIYLVARNFNEGNRSALKTAPVKFRIGNPDEPNVGVLFDADDKQFWTPEAAPFTQIFVLDRIPGLKSIQAHDIVLANSLYTLICTDIGVEFDSEASNHEILRSQNNGSNAIYASVSTAQMSFPADTVLDYLAHEKALKSCDGEWLVLHKEVEKTLQERIQESLDSGRKYIAKDGEYADMMLDALKNDAQNNEGIVSDLVDRGTAEYDDKGKKKSETTADSYFEKLNSAIEEKIQKLDESKIKISGKFKDKKALVGKCGGLQSVLTEYYKEDCIYTIKRVSKSIREAVITFDKDKDVYANNKLSLIDGILKNGKQFIHPVAAMVQLCRLRQKLGDETSIATQEWPELKQREITAIPEERLKIAPDKIKVDGKALKRSLYANTGSGAKGLEYRFSNLVLKRGGEYGNSKKSTKVEADIEVINADAEYVAKKLKNDAVEQLKGIIYRGLIKDIDLLIEKYKAFFSRFAKEKEDLAEETKSVLRKDCELVDSVLNIYSSEDDKKRIKDKVFKNVGPESAESLKEADDIVGKGVFDTVYIAARASRSDSEYNDRDASAYRSLFTNMVEAYKKFIQKSDIYKLIESYNIIEAMEAACEGTGRAKEAVFGEYFAKVQSLATPSLKIDRRMDLGDFVEPSNITVYMMSKNTAKYIKKHADELKLQLPQGQVKEDAVIKACAQAFIRKYSGDDSARVSVVSNMTDGVLYCTGEIMDITPLRIPKFNELSDESENIYYQNYTKALQNYKKYNTDMWNPHLGNNLHLRGHLPFMNEKKEQMEDTKMVKALIYGLAERKIIYTDGIGHNKHVYSFRYEDNGAQRVIKGEDGMPITIHNLVQLVIWLRKQDDIIDKWSADFDAKIDLQKRALPTVSTETQMAKLETRLTQSEYMNYFRKGLFEANGTKFTLLELAWRLKTSEEAGRDCDYADRVVMTSYEVFKDMISFRANPETDLDKFSHVYEQQLNNVFTALAGSKLVRAAGEDCEEFLKQIISWCEGRNAFVVQPVANDTGAPSPKFSLDLDMFRSTKEKIEKAKKDYAKAKEKGLHRDELGDFDIGEIEEAAEEVAEDESDTEE